MSINVIIIIHDYCGMIVGGEVCWTPSIRAILFDQHIVSSSSPRLVPCGLANIVTITLLILSHLWPLGLGVGLGVGVGL